MAKLTTYALAGALAFALAPVAGYAADLPEPPALEPAAPVEFGSAWYLRGDVGYKVYRDPKAKYDNPAYRAAGISNFGGEDMDHAAVIGGGVGYKFNNHFRSDLTVDYETPSEFKGKLPCIAGPGCLKASDNKTKISATTVLLNGYFDIATFGGITPYVGGGVGFSYVDMDKLKYTDYPTKCGCSVSGSYKGDDKWNFAYALMAGVGYNVTDNLVIDANYRFLDLGEARTKSIKAAGSAGKVKVEDIQAHEFRVGFRYLLD